MNNDKKEIIYKKLHFSLLFSLVQLLKRCQLLSNENKENVKNKIVKKSYINKNDNVNTLSQKRKPANNHN